MDKDTLIDLNSPNINLENRYKLASPLIPVPYVEQDLIKCLPRISDVGSNPFDKVLTNITNRDDPFDYVFESAFCKEKESHTSKEKENVGYLISPFETPLKAYKNKKNPLSPLYIDKEDSKINQSNYLLPNARIYLQNDSLLTDNCSANSSLQCLADSFLNEFISVDDIGEEALKIPLPDSPPENSTNDDLENESKQNENIENKSSISVAVHSDSRKSEHGNDSANSNFNNAFVTSSSECSKYPRFSTNSSTVITDNVTNNLNSFHIENLGTSILSTIYPSVSSTNSKDNSGLILNNAFCKESTSSFEKEKVQFCSKSKSMSARKPTKYELSLRYLASVADTPKKQNQNQSFGGFSNKAPFTLKRQDTITNDDSVFLEASYLANMFSKLAHELPDDYVDHELSLCVPPWLEEDVNFNEDECISEQKPQTTETESSINEQKPETTTEEEILNEEIQQITDKNETLNSCCSHKSEVDQEIGTDVVLPEDNSVQNARNLLHNYSEILRNSGQVVDQRKFRVNLLNSLAVALNVESPNESNNNIKEKSVDTCSQDVPKTDLKTKPKTTGSNSRPSEKKQFVPKIKTNTVNLPAGPAKLDKNLKPKAEKEKVPPKGPLKAVIPVKNMAKPKKSLTSKLSTFVTPAKSLLAPSFAFQNKRTSTPNDLKIKAPIAQSTPDTNKMNKVGGDKDTPVGKRQFAYSFSPLARPASTGDISYDLNESKPLSPKTASGSAPNVSNISLNKSASKQISNTSIPTTAMSRRKSASDLKAIKNNSSLKPPATQLKRSSSFQSKSSIITEKVAANKSNTRTSDVNKIPAPKIRASSMSKPRSSLPKVLSK